MKQKIRTRELTEADIPAAGQLIKSDWTLHSEMTPVYDAEKIAGRDISEWLKTRVLKDRAFFVLVAEHEDVIAGALLGRISDTTAISTHPRELVVEDIVTSPDYLRRGIASELLKSAETYAKEQGANQLTAYIYEFNEASKNLFQRNQYAKVAEVFHKFLTAEDKKVSEYPQSMSEVKLYADGGSRGNPGPSAGGFVILDMEDNVVEKSGKYLGITTNNQAEYHSLKGGLEAARDMQVRTVHVYMDSLLVVNQMKGIYKIKNRDLWPIHQAIRDLLPGFKEVTFTHVPRELNKLADGMVNETLDAS